MKRAGCFTKRVSKGLSTFPLPQRRRTSGKERGKERARPKARTNQKERAKANRATAHEARLVEAVKDKAEVLERGTWRVNGSKKGSARMPIASTSTSSRLISGMSNSLPGFVLGSPPARHHLALESVRATAGKTEDHASTEMRVSMPTTRQGKAKAAALLPLPKAWGGARALEHTGSASGPERGPGLPQAPRPDASLDGTLTGKQA